MLHYAHCVTHISKTHPWMCVSTCVFSKTHVNLCNTHVLHTVFFCCVGLLVRVDGCSEERDEQAKDELGRRTGGVEEDGRADNGELADALDNLESADQCVGR